MTVNDDTCTMYTYRCTDILVPTGLPMGIYMDYNISNVYKTHTTQKTTIVGLSTIGRYVTL